MARGAASTADAAGIVAVDLTHAALEQPLFPSDDGVILETEQHDDDRREPQQARAYRETDPQQDVADVQRVPDQRKWPAVDKRSKAVGPRARDGADMVNPPKPDELAEGDERDAGEPRGEIPAAPVGCGISSRATTKVAAGTYAA